MLENSPFRFIPGYPLLEAVVGTAAGVCFVRLSHRKIRASNDRNYCAMQEQTQQIDMELDQAGLLYKEHFAQQFPRDYAYSDAVALCLKAIENHRADPIGHAPNLYEDALHQRRMEKNIVEDEAKAACKVFVDFLAEVSLNQLANDPTAAGWRTS